MKIKRITLKIFVLCLSILITISALPLTAFASPNVIFAEDDPVPVNKNANQTCKNFYQYLWNCGKADKLVSGAVSYQLYGCNTDIISAEHDYWLAIKNHFGISPAIVGVMSGSYYKDTFVDELYKRYKQGAIPMVGYEPSFQYTIASEGLEKGDFIKNLDKTNPNRKMEYYNRFYEELKQEADFYEAMEEAGIEVYICRLFIEINNTNREGFYGETPEGYAACHRVWQQMVDYFTVERGLTGILFLYCSAGYATSNQFYPGDDYVDLLGPSSYSVTGNGEIFAEENCADYGWMKNVKRPFGFSELAVRSYFAHATPDALGDYKKLTDSLVYAYPEASFAILWYCDVHSILPPGNFTESGNYNGAYFMNSPNIIVAEEMPDISSSIKIGGTGMAQFYSGKKQIGNLPLGKFTAKNLKQRGITISEIDSVEVMHGTAILAYSSNDCTGKAYVIYGNKQKLSGLSKAKSLEIVDLDNLAFEKDIWVEEQEGYSAIKLNDGLNTLWDIESENEDGSVSIVIDLGKKYNIGQMSINHAGYYEDFKYNLRDFEIYVSNDDSKYDLVYQQFGNVNPASDFWFNPVNARYVKLKVITPNSSTFEAEKLRTSIAEIEVYGLDAENIVFDTSAAGVVIDDKQATGGLDFSSEFKDTTYIESDNEKEIVNQETYSEDQDAPSSVLPKIIIPKFYNYVWIIIAGGLMLLTGGVSLLMFLINKKKKRVL